MTEQEHQEAVDELQALLSMTAPMTPEQVDRLSELSELLLQYEGDLFAE